MIKGNALHKAQSSEHSNRPPEPNAGAARRSGHQWRQVPVPALGLDPEARLTKKRSGPAELG
ncbi:hypothetical protein ACLOJK_041942 [Asimina triloba]